MTATSGFAREIAMTERVEAASLVGQVVSVQGLALRVADLPAPVGSLVHTCHSVRRLGEVVGFQGSETIVMLLDAPAGVRPGDRVATLPWGGLAPVGKAALGRVLNGLAEPIDEKGPVDPEDYAPLRPAPAPPTQRRRIVEPLPTGVRVLDLFTTAGKGQRLGVFAGPGVGKSTLLGSIARNTTADVNVIALIGERGREVRDFLEASLGETGLARSVVVVATSDESPLLRLRAALYACACAEFFRDEGADVMLMMDSITRLAQAQRQVGLTAGEPPATKGYPPSVFSMLPEVLERAGALEGKGSITGFYTVLVEGDDMTEPIADAARGVLDGHIVLSRDLARKGRYPAVDTLDSISRVADDVCNEQQRQTRRTLLKLLAAQREVEELVQIGAYARGSNPTADVAMELAADLDALLLQEPAEQAIYDQSWAVAHAVAARAGELLNQRRTVGAAPHRS